MFQYMAIRWRCADRDKRFNQLVDADFANCTGLGTTTSACEDLIPTTTPTLIYPADPRLELTVAARTQHSVTLQWTLRDDLDVVRQVVTRRQLGSAEKVQVHLSASQRRHVLTGLQPNTTYKVCVELTAGNETSTSDAVEDPVISCCPASTSFPGGSTSTWASVELLLAVCVGGGLAAVVVVSVAVCCCCAARRRRRQRPQPSVQTKRYRKTAAGTALTSPPSAERTSNPYNADVDRAIVESVERLDPESKEVLANLLRSASAGSLDHIGGASYNYTSPSGAGSHGGQSVYDDLADDMYDQIPTDEFV